MTQFDLDADGGRRSGRVSSRTRAKPRAPPPGAVEPASELSFPQSHLPAVNRGPKTVSGKFQKQTRRKPFGGVVPRGATGPLAVSLSSLPARRPRSSQLGFRALGGGVTVRPMLGRNARVGHLPPLRAGHCRLTSAHREG